MTEASTDTADFALHALIEANLKMRAIPVPFHDPDL